MFSFRTGLNGHNHYLAPTLRHRTQASDALAFAAALDREADVEIFHGHHIRAEYLASRAAELRGTLR